MLPILFALCAFAITPDRIPLPSTQLGDTSTNCSGIAEGFNFLTEPFFSKDTEVFLEYLKTRSQKTSAALNRAREAHQKAIYLRVMNSLRVARSSLNKLKEKIANREVLSDAATAEMERINLFVSTAVTHYFELSHALGATSQPDPAVSGLMNDLALEMRVLKTQKLLVNFDQGQLGDDSEANPTRFMIESSAQTNSPKITRAGTTTKVPIHYVRTPQILAAGIVLKEIDLKVTSNILEIGYGTIPILTYLHMNISPFGLALGVDLHTPPKDLPPNNPNFRLLKGGTPTKPSVTKGLLKAGRFDLIYGVDVFKSYSMFGTAFQTNSKQNYLHWISTLLSDEGSFVIINHDIDRLLFFSDSNLKASGLTILNHQKVSLSKDLQMQYWVITPVSHAAETP